MPEKPHNGDVAPVSGSVPATLGAIPNPAPAEESAVERRTRLRARVRRMNAELDERAKSLPSGF
jgi:hypothetical protein